MGLGIFTEVHGVRLLRVLIKCCKHFFFISPTHSRNSLGYSERRHNIFINKNKFKYKYKYFALHISIMHTICCDPVYDVRKKKKKMKEEGIRAVERGQRE